MGTHITSLQIENVKGVRAFAIEPAAKGLTIIGGKNGQGKTTILDSIAWAIGGGKRKPSDPHRRGSMSDPFVSMTFSNGITVERKGKNSSLTVTDPTGQKAGQALLDALVSEFALDLPKFMAASRKDKARTLLDILGIGTQLEEMDRQEQSLYNERHAIGMNKDSKAKHANELPEYADAPAQPVSISELIKSQQDILATNGRNQELRKQEASLLGSVKRAGEVVEKIEQDLSAAHHELVYLKDKLDIARTSTEDLNDESTAEIETQIAEFEAINAQVAANAAKAAATDEAAEYSFLYDAKTGDLEGVRTDRLALLEGADLPLPGLSIKDGELVYKGDKWDGISGSDQLRVAVSIVRQLSPNCSFVLMDKLEQMDLETLQIFGEWLEAEELQAIATRVSTGDECTLIIEEGLPKGLTYADVVTGVDATEKEYEF